MSSRFRIENRPDRWDRIATGKRTFGRRSAPDGKPMQVRTLPTGWRSRITIVELDSLEMINVDASRCDETTCGSRARVASDPIPARNRSRFGRQRGPECLKWPPGALGHGIQSSVSTYRGACSTVPRCIPTGKLPGISAAGGQTDNVTPSPIRLYAPRGWPPRAAATSMTFPGESFSRFWLSK